MSLEQSVIYHVRVKGILDSNWSNWFDGLAVVPLPNGETLLAGAIVDQAALHGLLNKIRDLGLTLLYLSRIGPEEGTRLEEAQAGEIAHLQLQRGCECRPGKNVRGRR